MNIFHNLLPFLGGPGEAYVESSGPNVKKFAFLAIRGGGGGGEGGGGGLSGPKIIRPGPSCFPAIVSPISIYI